MSGGGWLTRMILEANARAPKTVEEARHVGEETLRRVAGTGFAHVPIRVRGYVRNEGDTPRNGVTPRRRRKR